MYVGEINIGTGPYTTGNDKQNELETHTTGNDKQNELETHSSWLDPKSQFPPLGMSTTPGAKVYLPPDAANNLKLATSIRGSRASKPEASENLLTFNSCFTFKLSECVGVFG
jgi:hypothetical protein